MDDYKIIVEQEYQTVAAHYDVEPKPAEGYQSEAVLEKSLIKQLQGQGYEYVQVKDEAGLLVNDSRNITDKRFLTQESGADLWESPTSFVSKMTGDVP